MAGGSGLRHPVAPCYCLTQARKGYSLLLQVQMNYPAENLERFPWIVSEGSLRIEDLLARYWQAAETTHSLRYDGHPWAAEHPSLAAVLERLVGEDSRESDWSEDQAADALDQLIQLLQNAAPTGFYFGASEGDGACLGFWPEREWLDALEERGLDRDLEDPADAARFIQAAMDYGLEPDTLYDGFCGSVPGHNAKDAGAAYAEQLANDCGLLPDVDSAWPLRHIDWEAAWRELELGDNYGAEPSHRAGEFWIFRSV